jgi:tetratricopeptide (TPR) repeat protein
MTAAARRCTLVLLATLLAAGCGPDPRTLLEPLPSMSLESFEKPVARRLSEARARIDELIDVKGSSDAELAEAFGELGKLTFATELIDVARACNRNAERLAPDDARWPYYLGHLGRFTGERERSLAGFERARKLATDDRPTLFYLGELYLDFDRLDDAEAAYRHAAKLGAPSGMAGLGVVLVARGEYRAALPHLEQALERVPAADRIHYHLSVVHARLGDDEKSRSHMSRQGPGMPRPNDPLMDDVVRLRDELRASPRSVDDLREAGAADSDDPGARLRLGSALANEGKLDEAEAHFRAALELGRDPQAVRSANLNLGFLADDRAAHAEAVEYYARVLEHDVASRGHIAYLELAQTLAQTRRFASAGWVYQRGRETLPTDATIANAHAMFLATCPDDTVRDGAAALQLASSLFAAQKSGPHAVTLAAALAENGRFEEAINLQRGAIAEAQQFDLPDLVDRLRQHLSLYENRKPLRQP